MVCLRQIQSMQCHRCRVVVAPCGHMYFSLMGVQRIWSGLIGGTGAGWDIEENDLGAGTTAGVTSDTEDAADASAETTEDVEVAGGSLDPDYGPLQKVLEEQMDLCALYEQERKRISGDKDVLGWPECALEYLTDCYQVSINMCGDALIPSSVGNIRLHVQIEFKQSSTGHDMMINISRNLARLCAVYV